MQLRKKQLCPEVCEPEKEQCARHVLLLGFCPCYVQGTQVTCWSKNSHMTRARACGWLLASMLFTAANACCVCMFDCWATLAGVGNLRTLCCLANREQQPLHQTFMCAMQ